MVALALATTAAGQTQEQIDAKLAYQGHFMAIDQLKNQAEEWKDQAESAEAVADATRADCTDPVALYMGDDEYETASAYKSIGNQLYDWLFADDAIDHYTRGLTDRMVGNHRWDSGNFESALDAYEDAQTHFEDADVKFDAAIDHYYSADAHYGYATTHYIIGSGGGGVGGFSLTHPRRLIPGETLYVAPFVFVDREIVGPVHTVPVPPAN